MWIVHVLWDHGVVRDIWSPVWPNWFASAVVGLWVVGRVKAHFKRHRKWQAQHFNLIHSRLTLMSGSPTTGASSETPPNSETTHE
jgi:hypothetical protein